MPPTSCRPGRRARARLSPPALISASALFLSLLPGSAPRVRGQENSGEIPFEVTGDRLEGRRTPEGEVLDIIGSVMITHGDLTARSRRGEYREDLEMVTLRGGVVINEREFTLRSDEARYFRRERRATAHGRVSVTDGEVTFRSPAGAYYRDEERAELWDGVTYQDEVRRIRSTRMTYLRTTGVLTAEGEVEVEDYENRVRVRGQVGRYWREGSWGWVTGDPVLTNMPGSEEAPFELSCDTLYFYQETNRAVASGNVVFRQEDTEATAGEAIFFHGEDRTLLRQDPVVTRAGSEVRGQELELCDRPGGAREMLVRGDAQALYSLTDSLEGGEVPPSRIAGETMRLTLRGEELRDIEVVGQASSVYYPPPAEGAEGEWNETEGDTMRLYFDDRRLERVEVRGRARGKHYLPPEAAAEEEAGEAPEEPVGGPEKASVAVYEAAEVDYHVELDRIDLREEAQVDYGDLRLRAGEIWFDSATQEVRAVQRPILWDRGDKILGTAMSYSLETRRGSIDHGRMRYEKGYYWGGVVRKVEEAVLNVDGGTYTSCDAPEPHYAFVSRRMKIYVKDKVVAKPLILYIGRVPVLALPFFVFPIEGDRRSGFLIPDIEFGWSGKRGRFVRRLGYYWAPNDYADVTFWADYFERQRWVTYLKSRYRVRYLLDGNFDGSYLDDFERGERRWDLVASHRQELGENMQLSARADFVSDDEYRSTTDQGRDQRLNRELRSDVAISRRWEGGTLNLALDRREYLDTEQVDVTLPRLTFSMMRRRLIPGGTGPGAEERWYHSFYYDLSGEVSNRSMRRESVETINRLLTERGALTSQRVPGAPRLAYQGRWEERRSVPAPVDPGPTRGMDNLFTLSSNPVLGGWWHVSPTFKWQATWFNRGAEDGLGGRKPGGWRKTWEAGGSTRTDIYGTFFPRWGWLQGIRHVVTPRMSFTYRPGFPQYEDRFEGFGGVSASVFRRQRSLNLSLDNTLHLKVLRGGAARNLNNVARLTFNSAYDFLYRDNLKTTGWADLRSSLFIQPPGGFDLRVATTHQPPNWRMSALSLSASLRLTGRRDDGKPPAESLPAEEGEEGERSLEDEYTLEPLPAALRASITERPWSLSLSHRFTRTTSPGEAPEDNYWLEGQVDMNLTTHWRLGYNARVDLQGKDVIAQEIFLYRDLHCWEARVVREYSNEEWRYYFKINIKAHPEIYAERGDRSLFR